MSMSVVLLMASFILSLAGLFVFIASQTCGLFGTAEEAYLWDDQVKTGQGLVALSILCACVVLVVAARAGHRQSRPSAV